MKPKPCPFCGSKEIFIDIKGVDGRVGCVKCRALGPRSVYYGDAAVNAWNTRPIESEMEIAVRRYERVRKMNAREFTDLYERCLRDDIHFDSAIDCLIATDQ